MPSPSADLEGQIPGLFGLNTQASSDLSAKLGGQLSPGTTAAIQNQAATYAAGNGMPGSNAVPGALANNFNLESLGMNSEAQTQSGLQDYSPFVSSVSGTQTLNPAIQANVSEENAANAAAPDPSAEASYAQQLFNQYLQGMNGPGGGSAGTTPLGYPTPAAGSFDLGGGKSFSPDKNSGAGVPLSI